MAKSSKKTRPDKYEPKLAIKGSFQDVIKVSVSPAPNQNPPPKKKSKK